MPSQQSLNLDLARNLDSHLPGWCHHQKHIWLSLISLFQKKKKWRGEKGSKLTAKDNIANGCECGIFLSFGYTPVSCVIHSWIETNAQHLQEFHWFIFLFLTIWIRIIQRRSLLEVGTLQHLKVPHTNALSLFALPFFPWIWFSFALLWIS